MIIIITKYIQTQLGPMIAGISNNQLCLLEFAKPERLSRTLSKLVKRYKYSLIEGRHPLLQQLEIDLANYFTGSLKNFNIPLLMIGTDFEKRVWNELLRIPFGITKSYLEIAKLVGNPTAFRAVARANGSNNISIIIPCHRVIASNGNLQGYGGEIWRKEKLLKLEKFGDLNYITPSKVNNLEKWIN